MGESSHGGVGHWKTSWSWQQLGRSLRWAGIGSSLQSYAVAQQKSNGGSRPGRYAYGCELGHVSGGGCEGGGSDGGREGSGEGGSEGGADGGGAEGGDAKSQSEARWLVPEEEAALRQVTAPGCHEHLPGDLLSYQQHPRNPNASQSERHSACLLEPRFCSHAAGKELSGHLNLA